MYGVPTDKKNVSLTEQLPISPLPQKKKKTKT